jgi:hypothetical protein
VRFAIAAGVALALVACSDAGRTGAPDAGSDVGGAIAVVGGWTSADCLNAPPELRVTSPDAGTFSVPEAKLGAGPVSRKLIVWFPGGLTGPLRVHVHPAEEWRHAFRFADNQCEGKYGCLVFGATPSCSFDLVFEPTADLIPAGGGAGPYRNTVTVCFRDPPDHCVMVDASFVP